MTAGDAELLRVEGLSRRFGDHEVLHGVSFQVRAGQAVAVVGPNGSGKSTLLQRVRCSQRPDGGTITLRGVPLRESDPVIRAEIAGGDDSLDFFPDLCVAGHLGLQAAAHDVDDADGVVQSMLAEVGLTQERNQLPGTLSSGQRRRLALASGFVRPRSSVVLDEPEQRLDGQGVDCRADPDRPDLVVCPRDRPAHCCCPATDLDLTRVLAIHRNGHSAR